MPPVIAVFGATGHQGGSVARSLLQNPSFAVRALTRNSKSAASQALASSGAEVVEANGFNSAEMLSAFNGAWGAFINLNSDDKIFSSGPGEPTEFDLGRTIINTAVQAGVRHLVFSSGPNCTEMTGGRVGMKAMDMKNKIEHYARNLNKFETVTFINAAWYLENFLNKEVAPIFGGFPYYPDEECYLTFRVPNWGGDNLVPFLSTEDDFGDIVQGIFLDPARWNGRVVHGVSEILSFSDLVSCFEEVTGRKARFVPILPDWEAFDTHGIRELEDVKLMFGFTQLTGGRYFSPEPSQSQTAAELKRETAKALRWPEEKQGLVTAREWFRLRFALKA